eukprot:TRINITY_DN18438_c0_g1_i1.p1 TRINITY_DN18438_c0_g1~~TRINITY_DN18438_c0_g1_i1.p1  ORF type:complete len:925 (+),score=356.68 TRINITY_DN18438_c0_g1_i1:75-2849(+)
MNVDGAAEHAAGLVQQLARQLQYESRFLDCGRSSGSAAAGDVLQSSLPAQLLKLDDLERQARLRPGPAPGGVANPSSKRARDRVYDAILRLGQPGSAAAVGEQGGDHDMDTCDDDVCDASGGWLDEATAGAVSSVRSRWMQRPRRALRQHDQERAAVAEATDTQAAAARYAEARALCRCHPDSTASARLRAGLLCPDVPAAGGLRMGLEGGGQADIRMGCFAAAMAELHGAGDRRAKYDRCLQRLRDAASQCPFGLSADSEKLHDAAAVVIRAVSALPAPDDAAQAGWDHRARSAAVHACREQLEADFRASVAAKMAGVGQGQEAADTAALVAFQLGQGHSPRKSRASMQQLWAAAYYGLRCGDRRYAFEALETLQAELQGRLSARDHYQSIAWRPAAAATTEGGIDDLHRLHESAPQEAKDEAAPLAAFEALDDASPSWPPALRGPDGVYTETVLQPQRAGQLRVHKPGSPLVYRTAVLLLLSRSATVSEAQALTKQLSKSAALETAHDHLWLQLALASHSPAAGADAYTIDSVRADALAAPMPCAAPEVTAASSAAMRFQWMMWSGCAAEALLPLLPPCLDRALQGLVLDGLHVAVLADSLRLLPERTDAGDTRRLPCLSRHSLHRVLLDYIVRLSPSHPTAALGYLSFLPVALREQCAASLCTTLSTAQALFGSVGAAAADAVSPSAADAVWVGKEELQERVRMTVAAARGSAGRDTLMTVELWLVAVRLTDDPATARLATAELCDFLLAQLPRAIASFGQGTSDGGAVSAAARFEAHFEGLAAAGGDALRRSVSTVRRLHWGLQMVACAESSNAQGAWDAWVHGGMLPRTQTEAAELAAAFNRERDQHPALRSVVRRVTAAALQLTTDALPHSADPTATAQMLDLAHALIAFDRQLTTPVSAEVLAAMERMRGLVGPPNW